MRLLITTAYHHYKIFRDRDRSCGGPHTQPKGFVLFHAGRYCHGTLYTYDFSIRRVHQVCPVLLLIVVVVVQHNMNALAAMLCAIKNHASDPSICSFGADLGSWNTVVTMKRMVAMQFGCLFSADITFRQSPGSLSSLFHACRPFFFDLPAIFRFGSDILHRVRGNSVFLSLAPSYLPLADGRVGVFTLLPLGREREKGSSGRHASPSYRTANEIASSPITTSYCCPFWPILPKG